MADDRGKQDNRDRSRVSGSEDYETRYFADRNGISVDQAHELIKRCGNDRKMLEREVGKLKGGS